MTLDVLQLHGLRKSRVHPPVYRRPSHARASRLSAYTSPARLVNACVLPDRFYADHGAQTNITRAPALGAHGPTLAMRG